MMKLMALLLASETIVVLGVVLTVWHNDAKTSATVTVQETPPAAAAAPAAALPAASTLVVEEAPPPVAATTAVQETPAPAAAPPAAPTLAVEEAPPPVAVTTALQETPAPAAAPPAAPTLVVEEAPPPVSVTTAVQETPAPNASHTERVEPPPAIISIPSPTEKPAATRPRVRASVASARVALYPWWATSARVAPYPSRAISARVEPHRSWATGFPFFYRRGRSQRAQNTPSPLILFAATVEVGHRREFVSAGRLISCTATRIDWPAPTAADLGIEVPATLLARADEVIE
jgi:hypothetical protein